MIISASKQPQAETGKKTKQHPEAERFVFFESYSVSSFSFLLY